jgi:hypothetical protein
MYEFYSLQQLLLYRLLAELVSVMVSVTVLGMVSVMAWEMV